MTRALPIRRAGAQTHAHRRLVHALVDMAGGPERAETTQASWVPWASATFQGMRHVIDLQLLGPDAALRAAQMAASLPEAEFALRGQIVADITVERAGACADRPDAAMLTLSALTIEEW